MPTQYADLRGAQGVINFQQGGQGNVQTVHADVNVGDIGSALDALIEVLSQTALPPALNQELHAELDTLRAQARKSQPNHIILREAGTTARGLLENMTASLLTPPALTLAAANLWRALGLGG